MKLADIVSQIQTILPKLTELVSDTLSLSSIVATSSLATIVTSIAHGITEGQAITITNVEVKTPVNSVGKSGNVYTFGTSSAHDLTEGWHSVVELSGFTNGDWNGEFKLVSANNRYEFQVQSINSLPSLNFNEVLHEVRADGINGRYQPTILNTTTLTIAGTFLAGEYVGGRIASNVRIAGAVNIDRAVEQYTKQGINDLWLFVTVNDVNISKDRNALSDALATKGEGDDIRLRMIDGFNLYLVVNTKNEMSAVSAIDICRHTLLQPLLQTLLGARFDTGLAGDADFKTVIKEHGIYDYTGAYLVYSYGFEFPMEITLDDAVAIGDDRAFRNIDYTERIGGDDTTDMTVDDINLDDNP